MTVAIEKICKVCGSNLKPSFTSLYCPNNCDITTWTRYKDTHWYYLNLSKGEIVPPDATHGWWINAYGGTIDQAIKHDPWILEDRVSKTEPIRDKLAVFKIVKS